MSTTRRRHVDWWWYAVELAPREEGFCHTAVRFFATRTCLATPFLRSQLTVGIRTDQLVLKYDHGS